jgi:excinuclease ABC subunit A
MTSEIYLKKKLSQIRGYQAKHFPFNVDGGRCETAKERDLST